jgi:hypothetical protein
MFSLTTLSLLVLGISQGHAQGQMSRMAPDTGLANQPATTSPYSTTQPHVTPMAPYYENRGSVPVPGAPSDFYPSYNDPSKPTNANEINSTATLTTQQNQFTSGTEAVRSSPTGQGGSQMGTQGGTQMSTQSGSTTSAGPAKTSPAPTGSSQSR